MRDSCFLNINCFSFNKLKYTLLKKGMSFSFLFLFFSNIIFGKSIENLLEKSHFSHLKSHILTHAFHTSITQIEYNSKAKTYEISVRLFTDDFEIALDTENKIKGTKILDGDKNDALVTSYISKHFTITSPQNKKASYKYIGKENEELATWIYLELPADQLIKGSKIQQLSMMELFDDQVNILNYRNGEERKTLLFDTKNKVKVWE